MQSCIVTLLVLRVDAMSDHKVDHESIGGGSSQAPESEGGDHVVTSHFPTPLPLNSQWLTASALKQLPSGMKLPVRASKEEVRQLIEGKLTGKGREPKNSYRV